MKKLFLIAFVLITQILSAQEIDFTVYPDNLNWKMKTEKLEDGLYIYTFHFLANNLNEPIEIRWESSSNNCYNYWTTRIKGFIKPDWSTRLVTSYVTYQAPLATLYDNNNLNRLTYALSDALNTIELSSGIVEETAILSNKIKIFPEAYSSKEDYDISLRVDTRTIPYWQSLQQTSLWWSDMDEYKPMLVPDEAKRPMYSTWYSFHQDLDVDEVVQNCEIAKSIGCDAVIVDDGWQTIDNHRGYAFTGDWQPDRIPQMKAFVDRIHALDMKFILWYSVPYVGKNAKVYHQFADKFLTFNESHGSGVLDPRYPEVRQYLINTYVKALNEWNLDGFKLDFVDSFKATDVAFKDGMDYVNVNEASDRLLTDVKNALIAIKPDILIEFRQSYIGPLMRKYGNMFRAGDCPFAMNFNRIKTADIRMLAGNTATHSDMIMWHPDESVEDAAMQLLNILYSVPQISVRLDKYPKEHTAMLKFWLEFWNKNRDALINSDLEAYYPNYNYPLLIGKSNDTFIATTYLNDLIIELDESVKSLSKIYVVNASGKTQIQLRSKNKIHGTLKTYDCVGNLIENKKVEFSGLQSFEVPKSGLLEMDLK